MALKDTIFGFYGTKSLRKNYNKGKNGKKFKNGKIEFFAIFPFFEKTLKRIVIIPFLPIL